MGISKLLYVSNARIPTEKAHGIHIMKMCEVFARLAEVELVVSKRFNKIKEDPFKYYGIERNFKIKKLLCIDLIPWDRYLGYFALWLESLSFAFSVSLYLLFKKSDIIYTREKSLIFLSFFRKNFIFEAHTFPQNYFLYSPFLKRVRGVVVITGKLKEIFISKGVKSDKILVAPDGVDLNKFKIQSSKPKIREELGLPQDKKIVLYTGHFYKWKGVQTLAEASQFLPGNTEVYFVGGTEEDIKKFKSQNSNLKINVVGYRPYTQMPYWLKAADVLVLPNSAKEEISKYWTSPLKMFEYMASGRPIVASNLPSIREILNEENSVLVEPDNPLELAEKIGRVLDNPVLAEKISTQAFVDVQAYTWQKRAEKIWQKLINI